MHLIMGWEAHNATNYSLQQAVFAPSGLKLLWAQRPNLDPWVEAISYSSSDISSPLSETEE